MTSVNKCQAKKKERHTTKQKTAAPVRPTYIWTIWSKTKDLTIASIQEQSFIVNRDYQYKQKSKQNFYKELISNIFSEN